MSIYGTIIDTEVTTVDHWGTTEPRKYEIDIAENALDRDTFRIDVPNYMTREDLVALAHEIIAKIDRTAKPIDRGCHNCGSTVFYNTDDFTNKRTGV